MSEASSGASSAPSTAPAAQSAPTASESSVSQANLPVNGSIDQGVSDAIEIATANAGVKKEEKAAEKATKDAEEIVEEALEDFAEIWKTKKGKETLKVNGKTREVKDYNDMKRLAQLGLAANEKFQQASEKIKQAEAIVELLQTAPEKALEKLGFNVRDLAEDYLRQQLQQEAMTDEERKMYDMEQKLAAYEQEKKHREDSDRQNKMVELQRHYEHELSEKIVKAIDNYKLPRNEKTISRIAEKLYIALENGFEIDPLDIAPLVKQEIEDELKTFHSSMGVEDLLELLGEDGLKKIREYEVGRVKAKTPANPLKTTAVPTAEKVDDGKPTQRKSVRNFFEELEKKYK